MSKDLNSTNLSGNEIRALTAKETPQEEKKRLTQRVAKMAHEIVLRENDILKMNQRIKELKEMKKK